MVFSLTNQLVAGLYFLGLPEFMQRKGQRKFEENFRETHIFGVDNGKNIETKKNQLDERFHLDRI